MLLSSDPVPLDEQPQLCVTPHCNLLREVYSLFCVGHKDEPGSRRGGWTSAWLRKQKAPEQKAADHGDGVPGRVLR